VLPPGYRALIYRDYGSPSPVFAGKRDVGVAFFRVGLTNQGAVSEAEAARVLTQTAG
jgi:hypothetical protein